MISNILGGMIHNSLDQRHQQHTHSSLTRTKTHTDTLDATHGPSAKHATKTTDRISCQSRAKIPPGLRTLFWTKIQLFLSRFHYKAHMRGFCCRFVYYERLLFVRIALEGGAPTWLLFGTHVTRQVRFRNWTVYVWFARGQIDKFTCYKKQFVENTFFSGS